jgi:hypothetical protein
MVCSELLRFVVLVAVLLVLSVLWLVAFVLLHAVLGRKLLVLEVYDVMDFVQRQMVT